MKMKNTGVSLVAGAFLLTSCIGAKIGSQSEGEQRKMVMKAPREVVSLAMVRKTNPQYMAIASRGTEGSRGLLDGSLLGLATNGIKLLIANDKKKLQANYSFALKDLYFYRSPSFVGPFDPVGMIFTGFTVKREVGGKENPEVAFSATFEPDLQDLENIVLDGTFGLKLTDLQLNYAKAKIPVNSKGLVNLDIEITFLTSYITKEGVMHTDEVLGSFVCPLRSVPVHGKPEDYQRFLGSGTRSAVSGRSFIVPRSFSYQVDENNETIPVYNRGNYSIVVKVKEATQNTFVNNLILEKGPEMVDKASKVKFK